MNSVVLRKSGGFYICFDDDAIIISFLCNFNKNNSAIPNIEISPAPTFPYKNRLLTLILSNVIALSGNATIDNDSKKFLNSCFITSKSVPEFNAKLFSLE